MLERYRWSYRGIDRLHACLCEQVRAFIPKNRSYKVLGTDGFGRSDSRAKLREFFEVNRYFVVAALKSLADEGAISASVVAQTIEKYGIDPQVNQIR